MHWLEQIKEIQKVKRDWHVMRAGDAMGFSSLHHVRASDEGSDVASDSEYVRDVACSIALQRLGEVPFVCVVRNQEESPQRWRFLHA